MTDFRDINLESSRLILKRCHYERDAEEINEVVLDTIDTLKPYLAWAVGTPTVQDTKNGLKRVASSSKDYAFRIYQKSKPEILIGMIGLNNCDGSYEVGYWCHKNYTCQGFMTESLAIIIEFAKTSLKIDKARLLTHPHNTPSRKLAEKFEFKETGFQLMKSSLRPEWGKYQMLIYEKKF